MVDKILPILFVMTHADFGKCLAGRHQHNQMVEDGWKMTDECPIAFKNSDQVEDEDDDVILADLVDDRAIEGLANIDVETIEDFKALAESDSKKLKAVKYITDKVIEKVLAH